MWFRSIGRKNDGQNAGEAAVMPRPAPVPAAKAPAEQAPGKANIRRSDAVSLPQIPSAPSAVPAPAAAAPNMWDAVGAGVPAASAAVPAAGVPSAAPMVPLPASGGANRAKTRLLSFDEEDTAQDIMKSGRKAGQLAHSNFPVGWLIVLDGPGRGACFPLEAGVSQIGRSETETIPLAFGDTSISRNAHASVAYDPESHEFFVGHGGKKNIVRHNDKPVLSTEALQSYDHIRIGETTLLFVALCSTEFNWSDADAPKAASEGA